MVIALKVKMSESLLIDKKLKRFSKACQFKWKEF